MADDAMEPSGRRNVSPSLSWSPGAGEPPTTVRMVAPIKTFWSWRAQMPLLS
ncbi:MAG: hypothetical protein ACREPK_06750 [Rhodanobacteraceae bacterium]